MGTFYPEDRQPASAARSRSLAIPTTAEHHCSHDAAVDAEDDSIVTSHLDYGVGRRLSSAPNWQPIRIRWNVTAVDALSETLRDFLAIARATIAVNPKPPDFVHGWTYLFRITYWLVTDLS